MRERAGPSCAEEVMFIDSVSISFDYFLFFELDSAIYFESGLDI